MPFSPPLNNLLFKKYDDNYIKYIGPVNKTVVRMP